MSLTAEDRRSLPGLPEFAFVLIAAKQYSRCATRGFTSRLRLASVSEDAPVCRHGHRHSSSRPPLHLAAEGGRGLFYRRSPRAVEHFSPSPLYRRTRSRPKAEAHAVHDSTADRWGDASAGELSIPVRGPFSGGRVLDGIAGRPRRGPYRRSDYHYSRPHFPRVAGDAGGLDCRIARRINPAGDSQQRRPVELRPFHVLEHTESICPPGEEKAIVVGNGAAWRMRSVGARARRARASHQTKVALRDSSSMGLVACPSRDCDVDVCRGASQDMEQHAHRDEP